MIEFVLFFTLNFFLSTKQSRVVGRMGQPGTSQ